MKNLPFFFAVLLFWTIVAGAQDNAPVRLALIAPEASLQPAMDLLTAELSANKEIVLLERTEIARVFREQSLSTANRDFLKLGQVLGADGLLIADLANEATGTRLGLRLVAVKPGVILGVLRSPWPVQDLARWVKGIPNHFAPLMPKLGVQVKDAVPLSVVNLRSAVSSRETRELEQQLTLLTIERLTRERELFVLERRRMESLNAENEFKGPEESTFWNGSYLLDGVVDRDGYSKERVTLHVKLTPPRSSTAVEIELSGPRTNLVAVADQLGGRILTALRLQNTTKPWNATEEAGRFFAEAQWAYQWGMLADAAAACEASWALGLQNKQVAELRIRSYYENGVDTALAWYDLGNKLITFTRGYRPSPGSFPEINAPLPGGGEPPDPARFDRIRRAMELYCSGFPQFVAGVSQPGWEWYDLGIDLLEGASYSLRHYYFMPEARVGQEEELAEVRALAREMVSLMDRHPAFTNAFGRDRYFSTKVNWGFPGSVQTERTPGTLLETKVNWGTYWMESPEQGAALYRGIVEQGQMSKVRRKFLTPDFVERPGGFGSGTLQSPGILTYLTGWTWSDRQRALDVWRACMAELCASTNVLTKAEGLFLRSAQARTETEHDRYFRELVAWLEAHKDTKALDNFKGDLGDLLDAETRSRAPEAAREARRGLVRQLLGGPSAAPTVANPDARAAAGPPPTTGNRTPPVNLPRTFPPSGPGLSPLSGKLIRSNVLEVSRFWALPQPSLTNGGTAPATIATWCFRENRLWVDARAMQLGTFYGEQSYINRALIHAVDLESLKSQAIELDPHTFSLPRQELVGFTMRTFEVHGGWLYLSSTDAIKRFSLKSQLWQGVPAPVQGHARITFVDGRMLASTEDSILEIAPEEKQVRILASRRRQPAETVLDSVTNYAFPPIVRGAKGSLIAFVGGKLYERERNGKDWMVLPVKAELSEASANLCDDGLILTRSSRQSEQTFALWNGSQSLELLFSQRPRQFAPMARGTGYPATRPETPQEPRWQLPEDNSPNLQTVCLDGNSTWVLASPFTRMAPPTATQDSNQAESREATLFYFEPGRRAPLRIPLRFQLPSDFAPTRPRSPFGNGTILLLATPKALTAAIPQVPGFWVLPRTELDGRIKNWRQNPTDNQ